MRKFTSFVMLTSVAALGVCAAQAPTPSSGADTPVRAAPSAASAATQSASTAPRLTIAKPQITFAKPRPAPSTAQSASIAPPLDAVSYRGYQQVVVHGKVLFCGIEPRLGSHIETRTVCLTQAQLQAQQNNARHFIEKVQHMAAVGTQAALFQGGVFPNPQ
ncbi:MAG TPA: hypothetical protein VMU67_06055 [Steroidobacteraceae bacterium]|nr:hypothetical protein [Steroidobacteraceae bacterium]